jgi:hypothetical protein
MTAWTGRTRRIARVLPTGSRVVRVDVVVNVVCRRIVDVMACAIARKARMKSNAANARERARCCVRRWDGASRIPRDAMEPRIVPISPMRTTARVPVSCLTIIHVSHNRPYPPALIVPPSVLLSSISSPFVSFLSHPHHSFPACHRHNHATFMCSSGRCIRQDSVCNPLTLCPSPTESDKLFCAGRIAAVSLVH